MGVTAQTFRLTLVAGTCQNYSRKFIARSGKQSFLHVTHDPEVIERLKLFLSPQIKYQIPYPTTDNHLHLLDNTPMVCNATQLVSGANENLWVNSTVAFKEGCTEHEQVAVGTE